MKENDKKPGFRPDDLPQSEVFTKKEIFQHPQPADQGLPLKPAIPKQGPVTADNKTEEEKTSKEEGLNEERSTGNAGAFEGFEDHSSNNGDG